jgi:parvulin-like peptidyl-prolyl isomerase
MKSSRILLVLIACAGALTAVAAACLLFFWGAYVKHMEGPAVRAVAGALPVPAARFAGHSVLLRDYLRDVRSIGTFLASEEAKKQGLNRAMTDADREQALERLLKELALEELAYKRKVEVTDEEVQDALMREFNPQGSMEQDFESLIMQTYVRPALLTRRLSASFAADHGNDPQALDRYLEERIQEPDAVRYVRF